nr:expressed protein [Hymenolepis microstoma]
MQTMAPWFFFLLLTIFQLQAKTHYAGKYKPICTGITLLNSSEARLTWIPPVMKNGEVPSFKVFYLHDRVLSNATISDNEFKIPVNENDTQISAVVRTVTQSDGESGGYKEDPTNECQFHFNRTNIFLHQLPESDTKSSTPPTHITLLPATTTTVELTWQPPYFVNEGIEGYQIRYSFGNGVRTINVTNDDKLSLSIEENAIGIEVQVGTIRKMSSINTNHVTDELVAPTIQTEGQNTSLERGAPTENIELHFSKTKFLPLTVDGPNTPIYVTLSRVYADVLLVWQPPKDKNLKIKCYEIIYNFDNKNVLNIKRTTETNYAIEIPSSAGILKAAVGVILEAGGDSSEEQVRTAYSSFKYLDLQENDDEDSLFELNVPAQ